FTLSGLKGNVDLDLLGDLNGDGHIDDGEIIAHNNNAGAAAQAISTGITKPGALLVHVHRTSGQSDYVLTAGLSSTDTAGSSPAAAKPIGSLPTSITTGEFIGAIDPDDFFS